MTLFFMNLALAQDAASPAPATLSRREYAAMLVIAEETEAARNDREHAHRMELLGACRVGLTGEIFGSAIKAKCDVAFASADAIRAGQPVTVDFRGGNVTASVPQQVPWMLYGAGYYANVAYGSPGYNSGGSIYGPAGAYDPSAEILRRLTTEVSALRTDTDNNSTLIDALTE